METCRSGFEATTGDRVDGLLIEENEAISSGPHGNVSINSHGEDLVIASEKVQAFTLLPGRSVDRGNQVVESFAASEHDKR